MEWVKEHEDYNSELQEVEKWLLQMSSRLVTSDSMQTSGAMEMATQQLARHKVTLTILAYKNVFVSCAVYIIALLQNTSGLHLHGLLFVTFILKHLTVVFQAIMEEIASFEERLTSLKQKGEDLVASCTDQVQTKISQQVQSHQQGTRDSYSAICSTAQRVSNTRLLPLIFYFLTLSNKDTSPFDHFQKNLYFMI